MSSHLVRFTQAPALVEEVPLAEEEDFEERYISHMSFMTQVR